MAAEFRWLKTWGLVPRLALVLALWALGIWMHIIGDELLWLIGLIPLSLAAIPLAFVRLTNKPKDQGKEEWRAVGSPEIDRLRDNIEQSLKLRKKLNAGCLPAVVIIAGVFWAFMALDEAPSYAGFAVDAVILLLTGLLGSGVTVFIPEGLPMKLSAFAPLLHNPVPEGLVLTPYLRFDEDEHGQDLPEDLRFSLEPRRRPADFTGVQFQCAVNNGPNGAVPYVYAVILTQGRSGTTHQKAAALQLNGYHVEPGGDDQWGTVVVRQHTTGTGYHTSAPQVADLYAHMAVFCQGL